MVGRVVRIAGKAHREYEHDDIQNWKGEYLSALAGERHRPWLPNSSDDLGS